MLKPLSKTLVCPACGDVIAYARYRRWPGNLVLTAVAGHVVNPIGAGVLRRIAERRLAEAPDAADRDSARDTIYFLYRSSAELVYELQCPRGHRLLRTAPQITRAMTRTPGDWVDLTQV
jgi:hypothetical protein